MEVIPLEVRINKEVRDYQESLFFGLSLRQFLFALLAVLVAVGLYFGLRNVVSSGEIGWICVLAAFPFALGGFFTYNGMPLKSSCWPSSAPSCCIPESWCSGRKICTLRLWNTLRQRRL